MAVSALTDGTGNPRRYHMPDPDAPCPCGSGKAYKDCCGRSK
ncbi:MAG: SEC-C domain-containing protein [Deltaproteobacteria bacterium]|nr:SEC-C domain-containing protein [Deltaproteobacteria bacterium]